MKDARKKGCSNEQCEMHQKKVKYSADNQYCPKCGTKLVFVCAKCFTEIEDIDYKHRICSLCEAKKAEKVEKAKDGAKKAGKAVVGVVTPVVVGVVGKVIKDGQNSAIKAGAEAVKGVAKVAVNAIIKK